MTFKQLSEKMKKVAVFIPGVEGQYRERNKKVKSIEYWPAWKVEEVMRKEKKPL
jgi:hypothetical protein